MQRVIHAVDVSSTWNRRAAPTVARPGDDMADTQDAQLEVTVWSDYLCPWCYLGLDRAEHLEEQHGATVTWMPYDLHPEIPEGGVDARRAYERVAPGQRDAYMGRLRALADEADLPVEPPEHIPKTRNALEVSEWVRREQTDAFPTFHERLFRAYWVEGRDLERVEVLEALADECGVDAGVVAEVVADRRTREAVDASTEQAQLIGVSGTPGWLIDYGGRQVYVPGAQPHETFDRVVSRLREKARGEDASG